MDYKEEMERLVTELGTHMKWLRACPELADDQGWKDCLADLTRHLVFTVAAQSVATGTPKAAVIEYLREALPGASKDTIRHIYKTIKGDLSGSAGSRRWSH